MSVQFQDAIASTAGRMKLLESMEGIVKGSQQVLVTFLASKLENSMDIFAYSHFSWLNYSFDPCTSANFFFFFVSTNARCSLRHLL